MSVKDHMPGSLAQRRQAKILTVDPAQRRIDAALGDGGGVQIAVYEIPPLFRWPIEGEIWLIYQDGGAWRLGQQIESQALDHRIEDLEPGHVKIQSDVIKTESGKDVVITNQTLATEGSTLIWESAGSGAWVPGQTALGATAVQPTSPVNGQDWYYLADSTNGVVWHFKYRLASASAYKWEYVGGPSLYNRVDGATNNFTSTTYAVASTNPGPTITLPLTGDYQFEFGAFFNCYANSGGSSGGGGGEGYMALGPTPLEAEGIDIYYEMGANDSSQLLIPISTSITRTAVAASTVVAGYYKRNATWGGGLIFSTYNRWMRVRPIRVA